MSSPTQAKIDGMRQSIVEAVAKSYGLPKPGEVNHEETKTFDGFVYRGSVYVHAGGVERKTVVDKVKRLEKRAEENGIKINFKKFGLFPGFRSKIKTKSKLKPYEREELLHSDEVRAVIARYPDLPQAREHEELLHSYEIISYEIPNLLEKIEKAPDHQEIEKAVEGNARTILKDLAGPAFSLLPELYEKYVGTAKFAKNAAEASDCKEIYEKIRKNEMQREKETSKVAKLLRLDAGPTYDLMEYIAEALLKEKLESIEKGDFVTEWPSSIDKIEATRIAFKSYKETMDKIDALRNQFIEKKEPPTPA